MFTVTHLSVQNNLYFLTLFSGLKHSSIAVQGRLNILFGSGENAFNQSSKKKKWHQIDLLENQKAFTNTYGFENLVTFYYTFILKM